MSINVCNHKHGSWFKLMVPLAGFEPTTVPLRWGRSVQLSYRGYRSYVPTKGHPSCLSGRGGMALVVIAPHVGERDRGGYISSHVLSPVQCSRLTRQKHFVAIVAFNPICLYQTT